MIDKDVLINARQLIESESSWTKGMVARDKDGYRIELYDSKAVCFCAYGAVAKTLQASLPREFIQPKASNIVETYLDKAVRKLYPSFRRNGIASSSLPLMIAFNDGPRRKHADVLRIFDTAIEEASK
ncbi:hypothetical protein EVB91_156 [Rhizobium phage RHph_I1_18]|nr:hypothetical protein EVB91_156 [Rhizobium phage RHph_I1_18]